MTSPTAPAAAHPPHARPGPLLLALACAGSSFALMQAIIVPALGEVQRDLGGSTAWVAWTVSIYLLSAAVATPLIGRLGDQHGKHRMLMATLAAFTLGSVACVVAWDVPSLIAARALQGVSGAVYPLCFSIIRDEVPAPRMGVAMGLISSMLGVGGGLGLVMSGLIVDHGSWRLLFVLGAVLGVAAMALVRRDVPPSPHRAPASLDLRGAALLSAGLVLLLVALTQGAAWGWGSARVLGLAGAGGAVLLVWGAVEARTARPMVDMRMLARRPVLFTNLAGLFCGFAMYASFTVLPLLAQMPHGLPGDLRHLVDYGFDASVTVSALYLLPGALLMLPAGPWGGVLGRRIGFRYALALGLAVAGAGGALLAAFHDEPWQLVAAYAVGAVGVAVAFGAMPKLIADAVRPTETGVATGMNTVVRTIGSAIGAQVAVTLLASRTIGDTGLPAESGFTISLWLAAGAGLVGAALALAVAPRRRSLRSAPAPSAG